jgi:hypothetical protein
MKMNTMNTIEFFAQLPIATMTDSQKIQTLQECALTLGVTENRFIEIMKNEIKAIKAEDCYFQKTLENAIYLAKLECALFNARRCYHTKLAFAA